MEFPEWAIDERLSAEDQERARLRFLVKLAALYAHPSGDVTKLCEAIEFSEPALAHAILRRRFSAGMAAAIENAVGKHIVSKEMLRPTIPQAA